MLPAFVDRFETVSVRIEDVGCVIPGVVVQARAGFAVVNCFGRHRSLIECVHLRLTFGNEADMRGSGVCIPLFQPEEYTAVPPETLEIRVAFGAIPAVVVDDMHDAERLENPLVEGNRAAKIRDGNEDVVEQNMHLIRSTILPPATGSSGMRILSATPMICSAAYRFGAVLPPFASQNVHSKSDPVYRFIGGRSIPVCYHAATRSSGHSAVSLSGGGQDLLQCRPQLMQRKCLLNKGRGALVQHLLLNLFCAESTKNYDR